MKKTRFTEEQIIGVLKLAEAVQTVAEICRGQGISEATFYRWKAQYGGLEVSQLRRLREVEDENRRLKQIVADLTLDNTALKDVLRGEGCGLLSSERRWGSSRRTTGARSGGLAAWFGATVPRSAIGLASPSRTRCGSACARWRRSGHASACLAIIRIQGDDD